MYKEKPKIHVIYCHPSEKSITHDIKEAYLKGLKEKNIEYTITDLYNSDFKTDITEEEYLRENNNVPSVLTDDIKDEHEKINNADVLTFIFPLFWMDAPSKLVGYFSRVFTKGFKYDYDDNTPSTMKVMKETNFLISAGSSFNDLKKDGKVKALETIFIKDRLAGKTLKSNMYFFTETTYEKEVKFANRKQYVKKAEIIGKSTI